jgi:hypothetical protein
MRPTEPDCEGSYIGILLIFDLCRNTYYRDNALPSANGVNGVASVARGQTNVLERSSSKLDRFDKSDDNYLPTDRPRWCCNLLYLSPPEIWAVRAVVAKSERETTHAVYCKTIARSLSLGSCGSDLRGSCTSMFQYSSLSSCRRGFVVNWFRRRSCTASRCGRRDRVRRRGLRRSWWVGRFV